MTTYVDAPDTKPVQGIWCFPPDRDDAPSYVCDRVKEGFIITDLLSARRFFREKCRWSVAGGGASPRSPSWTGRRGGNREAMVAWPALAVVRVGEDAKQEGDSHP
jgi:hypothetical protein